MNGNMKLDESRLLAWYRSVRWLFLGVGAIALVTFVAVLLSRQLSLANLAFLFILPVIAVSGRYGLMRGSITAALSTLAFNFFLVPPRYTLLISDTDNVVTLAALFAVAFAVSNFAARLQEQASAARQNAADSEAIAKLTSKLGQLTTEAAMRQSLVDALSSEANCAVTVNEADDALPGLAAASPSTWLPRDGPWLMAMQLVEERR
jgi:two-component system sensor histidine kinase KdpD